MRISRLSTCFFPVEPPERDSALFTSNGEGADAPSSDTRARASDVQEQAFSFLDPAILIQIGYTCHLGTYISYYVVGRVRGETMLGVGRRGYCKARSFPLLLQKKPQR